MSAMTSLAFQCQKSLDAVIDYRGGGNVVTQLKKKKKKCYIS